MNLIEPILYQCKLNPFAIAIGTPGSEIDSISYGQFEKLTHNVARAAIEAGLAPGDIAALHIEDAILHAVVLFALMRIGVITMSLGEASLPEHVAVNVVVSDAPNLLSSALNILTIDRTWLQGDGAPLDYEHIYQHRHDDTCSIKLTSGSTGHRKGVALTHSMLAGRVAYYGYSKSQSFARLTRIYCGFGISTTPGYTYMLYVLSHGGTIYFSGSDIAAFLQYAAPYRIQGAVTSPYNLDGLLKFFEAEQTLECSFEVIISQGARLSRELSNRVRSRMCQNLFTSYGSTETATCAFGPAEILNMTSGAVGFVCPGYVIDIVNANDQILSAQQEGSIRIRSSYSASGYVNDPDASAQMFRNDAFYIGDRGYMTTDGILVITGREKTALLISGDSIAPEIIEEVLCGCPGIDQAAVCTVDDALGIAQIHALIVAKPDIDEAALRAHCESRLRNLFVPESFIKVQAIPRSGQGKIDRPRIAAIAAAAMKSI